MNENKMASGYTTTWSFFLHILILMCVFEGGGRVMAREHAEEVGLRLHSMDADLKDDQIHMDTKHDDVMHGIHDHAHVHTPHNHMDQSANVFLVEKSLKVGNKMPIYFPHRSPSTSPHFLPREEADSIPFSSDKLPYLLQTFSFSDGTPQAKATSNTLLQCEAAPIDRETKFCATSLEAMLDFARSIFGMGAHFKIVSTIHHRNSIPTSQTNPVLHNYTIVNIRDLSAISMVACHTMPYPYTVFYCHHTETQTKVFKVSVISEDGDEEVDAVVVCHMDTSEWNPAHVSFRVLKIKPGADPVCHFFPQDHLVWVLPAPSV